MTGDFRVLHFSSIYKWDMEIRDFAKNTGIA